MPKKPEKPKLVNNGAPKLKYAEGARKEPNRASFQPSTKAGSALHQGETEQEALARIHDRIWGTMMPFKQPYDLKCREIDDAYMGIVREARTNQESKVFHLVFMMVDAKLGAVLSNRPKAVFEADYEKQKLGLIEHAYKHYTTDEDDGVNQEAIDHLWHWQNELYGWSIKRVWHEIDTQVGYEARPVEDERGNIVFNDDGFAKLEYRWCVRRNPRIRQKVYDYDKVAVDPTATFLFEADDIVFVEDIHYNDAEQRYGNNPLYKNWEFVSPGVYYDHRPLETTRGTDSSGNPATVFAGAVRLERDRVRVEEYYCRSRCECMLRINNIPLLHIPNPTPGNLLPAADLHNHLAPKTFYSMGEAHITEPIVAIYQKMMNAKTRLVQLAASPVVLTDSVSGITPKSVKVYPGAHWKGMKGRVEPLDLSGNNGGEVTEYLAELRNLAKIVTGNDFERLIADPDPTAIQQAARDAASRLRPEKDIRLQESIGHVRSMRLVTDNIQYYVTIPELARIEDMPEEERAALKDYDKLDAETYYKYPKIRTEGVIYIEEYDGSSKKLNLRRDRKARGNGFIYGRPEFLRTSSKLRIRAVSSRSETINKQVKFEMHTGLMQNAFALPAKNQAQIDQAIMGQQAPPAPEYFINREKAVEGYIQSVGADVEEYTAPEGEDTRNNPAVKAVRELIESRRTLLPDPKELPQLSFSATKPANAQPTL